MSFENQYSIEVTWNDNEKRWYVNSHLKEADNAARAILRYLSNYTYPGDTDFNFHKRKAMKKTEVFGSFEVKWVLQQE